MKINNSFSSILIVNNIRPPITGGLFLFSIPHTHRFHLLLDNFYFIQMPLNII